MEIYKSFIREIGKPVYVLWTPFSQQCHICFREPALFIVQLSQPPILLLLQNLNDVVLVEVQVVVGLCCP